MGILSILEILFTLAFSIALPVGLMLCFRRKGGTWTTFLIGTVTFGLYYKKGSPRIDAAPEPYPNRWTHHNILISSVDEIDDELMAWTKEAAAFSAGKR